MAVRSFDNLAEYTGESRDKLSITYQGSWDDSLFSRDWSELAEDSQELFPVVLPKYLYDAYGLQPGDTIGVSCGSFRLCAAAGYYSGSVDGLSAPLLMPNSAVETMAGDQMLYARAQFSLDPTRNRELNQFRSELDGIIDGTKSKLTLRTVVRDDELRQAVEPLEDRIFRVTDMVEKPTPDKVLSLYSILGRCVLPAEVFSILENTPPGAGGELQLTDAMRTITHTRGMTGVDYVGKRYDMGNKLGVLEAIVEVGLAHPEIGEGFRDYLRGLCGTL